MIYCPNCGTTNRDGSKFCNECGQTLAAAREMTCPECGQTNALSNIFCVYCGASMKPAEEPPEEPAETPIGDAPVAEESATPKWLEQLRAAAARESSIATPESEAEAEIPATDSSPTLGETPPLAAPTSMLERWRTIAADAETGQALPSEDAKPASTTTPLAPSAEAGANLPAWLEEPVADEAVGTSDVAEMPDWLVQLRRQAVERPADTSALINKETRTLAPEASAAALAPLESPGIAVQAGAPDDVSLGEPTTDTPQWLRDVAEATPSEAPLLAEAAQTPLAEMPASPEATASVPELETPASAGDLTADALPDWVQALRPIAPLGTGEAPTLATGEHGAAGVLRGLKNIIPIALPIAAPPDAAATGVMLTAIPAESEASAAFARALTPAAPNAIPTAHKGRSLAPYWRVVVALLLLLAICVPFVTDWRFLTTNSSFGGARANRIAPIQEQIAGLEANSTVLVAFDFDASTADEMRPLAQTLIAHLMRQNVQVVTVSMLPGGAPIASEVLAQVADKEMMAVSKKPYVNLGYLVGQQTGLRAFASDPFGQATDFDSGAMAAQTPLLQGVSSLDDLALIVLLEASHDTTRWWIEQVKPHTKTLMIAGVSAGIEPALLPYASGSDAPLNGILAGLPDAAAYAQMAGIDGGLDASMEALSWTIVVALLIILVTIFIAPLVDREGGK